MIKAAVDIGTNSTRLYVADVDGRVKRLKKITTITRLGKMVDKDRRIGREGIEKNIELLLEYKNIAMSYGVEYIKAIATSAVRDALNRDEFISMVKDKTGIDVLVISGREEARLGFIGASSVLNAGVKVVVDIGGGSTELICGSNDNIYISNSIDVGAVRMTERFLSAGIIEHEGIEETRRFIRGELRGTIADIKKVRDFTLIGIGGTITTLAAIDQELMVYDIEKVHGYKLTKYKVDDILQRLVAADIEGRKAIPGLQKERADIIPAGTLILQLIMEELNADSIIVSEMDNLDGIMIDSMMQTP